MKELKRNIDIDIGDWVDEYLEHDPAISGEEGIVNLVDEGYSTGQIARMAVAARENELAPPGLLLDNKMLLYAGARADIAKLLASRTQLVKIENGHEIEIRALLGSGEAFGEGTACFVPFDSEEGVRRAYRYLEKVVPGHIYNHLKVLAAVGGDVEEAGEQIKGKVDELVGRLTKEAMPA